MCISQILEPVYEILKRHFPDSLEYWVNERDDADVALGQVALAVGTPLCPYGLPTVGSYLLTRLGYSKCLRSPLCGRQPLEDFVQNPEEALSRQRRVLGQPERRSPCRLRTGKQHSTVNTQHTTPNPKHSTPNPSAASWESALCVKSL